MLTVILLITAVICLASVVATYKPQSKYKNGMLFAVTLPAEALEHADIQKIQAQFNKRNTVLGILMSAFLIPLIILHHSISYQTIYFFVWLTVLIVCMVNPFRRAFRDTLNLKRENDWYVGERRVILSDLRVAQLKNQRSASLWLFIIPLAMAAGIMLLAVNKDIQLVGIGSGGVVITTLFLFTDLLMRRSKAKVYSMNSDVNLALNQARRRALSYLWLFMAIAENIHFLFIYILLVNEDAAMEGVWITCIVLISLIPVSIVYSVYRKIQTQEQEVLAQDSRVIYTDEDEYWSNGFSYHNPNDKSVFVPKRVGMGDAVNTATVPGKFILWGAFGLMAVVMIGVSFLLIQSELTSPALSITADHRVEIDYPMYSYDFNFTDIEQLTLVEQLPATASRTNGEATEKHARGHFRIKGLGKARMYIFKNNPPYIQIKLKDAYIFYNDKEPLKTKQLFERLQSQIGK